MEIPTQNSSWLIVRCRYHVIILTESPSIAEPNRVHGKNTHKITRVALCACVDAFTRNDRALDDGLRETNN